MARTKKAKKLLTEAQKKEQARKKKEAAFRRKIRTTFMTAGFAYLPSNGKEFKIGLRVVELDYLFIYDNVVLICEDTCGQKKDKDHIRKKSESFQEIKSHLKEFFDWMINTFPNDRALVEKYRPERYQVFYLYIPQNELDLTADERALYGNLLFVEPETLSYFNRMTQCIH